MRDDLQDLISNDKQKRLNKLHMLLLQSSSVGDGLSIGELAKEFGVSEKTIQRDLATLGDVVSKKGRLWYIKTESKNTQKTDDALIFSVLDEMAKSVGDSFYCKAHILLKQAQAPGIFAHLDCEKLSYDDMQNFIALEKAIESRVQISFDFNGKNRVVRPLKLAFFDGFWYLLAYEQDFQNLDSQTSESDWIFKKFYMKNISHIQVSDTTFEVQKSLQENLKNAQSVWFKLIEPKKVHLFIDSSVAQYLERKPRPTQRILDIDKKGNLEIEIEITDDMEILPLIFHYMPCIKVLAPKDLAKKVRKITAQYLKEIS